MSFFIKLTTKAKPLIEKTNNMEINPLHLLKRFNELRTDDYMVLRTEFAKVSLLVNYLKHLIRHRNLIKLSITFFFKLLFSKI